MRRPRMPLLAAGIAVLILVPGIALAQSAGQSGTSSAARNTPAAPASSATTSTYDLSFTLPTAGKSGCMVCHGDPNLVRIQNGQTVSMYIDTAVIESSAHAKIQCTGCHLDFAYSVPHVAPGNEAWRSVAKAACKNCHQEAFAGYSKGVHSPAPTPSPGTTSTPVTTVSTTGSSGSASTPSGSTYPKPLCGDCHGAHDIRMLTNNPAGQEALHARGKEVCGNCHPDFWNNYADSYHGSAYKRGAKDAPACWQCHGPHDIIPSSDRRSSVNEVNLVDTCSACHHNQPNEEYVTYSVLVHNRNQYVAANPIAAFWQRTFNTIKAWFD